MTIQTTTRNTDASNTSEAIVTKNELTISIDEVKNIIVVKTPCGQQITLSDDAKSITMIDSNNNKVTLSSDGIELCSCKDVKITASGSVNIAANGGAASIKGSTEISASAPNINASASVGLTLKGDASAQLTSSASTTIKGAMVMIN